MSESLKLTAGQQYTWTAVITEGPMKRGANAGKGCSGVYAARSGDTVGDALIGIKSWYGNRQGIPASQVTLVRYTLQELS